MSKYLETGLDLKTAIITIVLAPIVVFTLRRVGKYALHLTRYLTDWTLRLVGRTVMHSLAGRISMRDYCKFALRGPSQWLTVPGLREVKLKTDEMFVPLLLTGTLRTQKSYSSDSILDAGNRILIVGDPGSGKSSLVKRLYRNCAAEASKKPTRSRLPILVSLPRLLDAREPFDGSSQWAMRRLEEELRRSPCYEPKELLDSCLQVAGVVLLLDGLDEVSSESYRQCLEAIGLLAELLDSKGENNCIIITMRSSYFHQVSSDLSDVFSEVLYVSPLTPGDIFEFLLKWPFGDSHATYKSAVRVHRELTDRPTLREMCSNPLILAMYVSHAQLTGAEAGLGPETRTQFYDRVVEELLVLRRGRQGTSVGARTALREQRESLLGRLALSHMLDEIQPANSLSWATAVSMAQDTLSCDVSEAIAFLNLLMKETGLFEVEREGQSIRFIHLTFCEFMAAVEATRGRADGLNLVIDKCEHYTHRPEPEVRSRLLEVLPFAMGLTPRANRYEAISIVLSKFPWPLVARCLLETQAYSNIEWRSKLRAELDALSSAPEDEWGAEWFNRLRLASVIVEDAARVEVVQKPIGSTVSLSEFYDELIRDQRSRLITMFSSIARQEPSSAFRLAAQAGVDLLRESPEVLISSMSEPVFASVVYDHASTSSADTVEWATILAEAALRFRSVCASLGRQNALNAEWSRYYSSIRPSDRWGAFPEIPTLMQEAVSIAIEHVRTTKGGEAESVYECLTQLASLPSWRQLRLKRVLIRSIALSLLLAFIVSGTPISQVHPFGTVGHFWPYIVGLYFAGILTLFFYSYASVDRFIYSALLNVGSNPFRTGFDPLTESFRLIDRTPIKIFAVPLTPYSALGVSILRLVARRRYRSVLADLDEIRATS